MATGPSVGLSSVACDTPAGVMTSMAFGTLSGLTSRWARSRWACRSTCRRGTRRWTRTTTRCRRRPTRCPRWPPRRSPGTSRSGRASRSSRCGSPTSGARRLPGVPLVLGRPRRAANGTCGVISTSGTWPPRAGWR